MLICTTEIVAGKKVVETKGFVKGSTIRAKNLGKDILAGFKHMVGGEIKEYQKMMEESRKIAIARMVEDAEAKGANAILGFRLGSAMVMQGASEVIAYGTAVVLEDE